jgi:hypothetical protein
MEHIIADSRPLWDSSKLSSYYRLNESNTCLHECYDAKEALRPWWDYIRYVIVHEPSDENRVEYRQGGMLSAPQPTPCAERRRKVKRQRKRE